MRCVLTAARARLNIIIIFIFRAGNLIITTLPPLSDLLHLSYIPASESEEVLGNMKQHAADERVILVRADAPTPQLFNNTTTEAHSLTDNFDRSLFNPFHNFQRTSNHLIWMEKL